MWHDVVLGQKREWESIRARSYVARTSAPAPAAADLARVVIGPRRAGKSCYAAHLAIAGDCACGYLNFDDERLASPAGKVALDELLAAVDEVYGYLEQAFLCFTVPRFSFKPREQSAAPKKCYAIDTGLVEAAGFMSSASHGRLLENLVAIALHRRQLRGELQLFYWQDPQKSEVDFVIHQDRTVKSLVQVCATGSEPKTRARELRGLLNASRALGCTDLLLLTEDTRAAETLERWQGYSAKVRWQPVSTWLLDQGR